MAHFGAKEGHPVDYKKSFLDLSDIKKKINRKTKSNSPVKKSMQTMNQEEVNPWY